MDCYEFEKILYKNGFFDKIIEVTYIIHLRDNGRIEHIREQLEEYNPSKIVYIVYNEGFKKCEKSKHVTNPPTDLIETNLNILKHSMQNKYKNILILEDDFIFNPKIKEQHHINNVVSFIKQKQYEPIFYLLGCAPIIQLPYDYYHNRPILSGGNHAVIYNDKMREIILSVKQENIKDWDEFGIWFAHRYAYYIPLCYQLFPETENSKFWGGDNNYIIGFIKQLGPSILKMLNMDKTVEPGYTILYVFSKLILPCIILLIIAIILMKKNKNLKLKRGRK